MTLNELNQLLAAADKLGLKQEFDDLLADANRWRHVKSGFSVMSPNIDGNHYWTWRGYHELGRGGNIDEAADNGMKGAR